MDVKTTSHQKLLEANKIQGLITCLPVSCSGMATKEDTGKDNEFIHMAFISTRFLLLEDVKRAVIGKGCN